VNNIFASKRPIRRIGLLSPTSGNLGNATMQSAMIASLRKRIAGVEIVGITLNPADTRCRHGIRAFPLAAVSRPYFTLFTSNGSRTQQQQARAISRIRQWVKQIPLLGKALRAIRNCGKELAHIVMAARVVSGLDRVIVPGGGAVDDLWGGAWGHPWSLFKWSVLSRAYGVPFLFVSIGKSSLEQPLSRLFVRVALRLAAYRSYRDYESKIAVQTLIDARNDPVYPDLAFSYPDATSRTSPRNGSQNGRLVVGVSPIAYCDPRAWPRKDERRYTAYVGQMAEMVNWLTKQGYRVLFFTTDAPDTATVEDVQATISGSAIDAGAIQTLPSPMDQSPESLMKGISRADLVIASRLHGVILSHLNAIPVLALSFDPKVDAHMNAMQQKEYCLSIDHLQPETLIERFSALKAARQREHDRLRSIGLRFRDLLESQYDELLGEASSDPIRDAAQN
jgi:polysaccharide pyruvyl transferase WcaK-like protein